MIRAHAVLAPADLARTAVADVLVLDYEGRRRRRGVVQGVRGTPVLVDLADTPTLRHGDGLALDDGTAVEIVAAPEALMEASAASPVHLVRLAWHVGNRHLEAEIMPAGLRLRRDHVIAAMLRGLGARVRDIEGLFQPEGGAYEGGHGGHGAHGHGHHGHGHGESGHGHAHPHGVGHAHGPGGHDHAHPGHDHAAQARGHPARG